jgi:hypothetical protein
MKLRYKFKKIPFFLGCLFILLIDVVVIFLAKDFGPVLVIVWVSGAVPSLFIFSTATILFKLIHVFYQPRISHTEKINFQEYGLNIIYKLMSILLGGLVSSSIGVILYWWSLVLLEISRSNLLHTMVDILRKISGQSTQYQEVYYALGGILVSFLTAIPGMVIGKNLVQKEPIGEHRN